MGHGRLAAMYGFLHLHRDLIIQFAGLIRQVLCNAYSIILYFTAGYV